MCLTRTQRDAHCRGFSLIEVLVSLVILAGGLLGMTALQNEALKYNHAAFTESQAMFLIGDMVERIRANHAAGSYAIAFTENAPAAVKDCDSAVCSPAEMATWDVEQWRNTVGSPAFLPNGESAITFDPLSNEYTVSIRYEWSHLGAVDLTDGLRTVSVTTRID